MIEWDESEAFRRKYGSAERARWVQSRRSVVSGGWPCVNAHVTPDVGLPSGTGRKGSYQWVVPMTDAEHREMHQVGEHTFQQRHAVDLPEAARQTEAAWQRRNRGQRS